MVDGRHQNSVITRNSFTDLMKFSTMMYINIS